jgi:hypothetical protein
MEPILNVVLLVTVVLVGGGSIYALILAFIAALDALFLAGGSGSKDS